MANECHLRGSRQMEVGRRKQGTRGRRRLIPILILQAKEFGLHAIHFTGAVSLREELRAIGVEP